MFSPETALRLQAVTEAHARPAQPEEEAQKLPKASVTAPERKEKPQKPVQAARVPLGEATVLNSRPWPPAYQPIVKFARRASIKCGPRPMCCTRCCC